MINISNKYIQFIMIALLICGGVFIFAICKHLWLENKKNKSILTINLLNDYILGFLTGLLFVI